MGVLTVIWCVLLPAALRLHSYGHLPGLGVFLRAFGCLVRLRFCASVMWFAGWVCAGSRPEGGGRGDGIAVGEARGVEPVTSGYIGVAAGIVEAGSQVMEWFDSGVAKADVVASCQVTGEFLGAEDCDDRPSRVGYEGHASFDQDIGPGLEPPRTVVTGRRGDDVLVGGEERDDGLNVLQCFFEHVANERACAAAGPDELAPLAGL